MDVVNAILRPVVDSLMVPVKKHLGYMVSFTKYARDMRFKMNELNEARAAVEEHRDRNISKRLKVPSQVNGWLDEVDSIKAKVENIPSDVGSCCNLKIRHKLGREACKIIEEIESVIVNRSLINWTDDPIPLGKVDSMKPSTSTPSNDYHDFDSRHKTFMKALKALEPDHKSHMIALCGMGGVGKTTMMKNLKKTVEEKKMFNFIIEAVVGEKTDPIAVQQAVADYLSVPLDEKTKPARADKLRKSFKNHSNGGKNKILVILDDVWELVDLEDIGLSSSPNPDVDFKVLLTSRSIDVCSSMRVQADSIINVEILTKPEAQKLFWQFVKDSDEADLGPNFQRIGNDIVCRCHGLPIAIKTMACNLKGRIMEAWDDALHQLKHYDIYEIAVKVFEMSYKNLKTETKSTFLLCGLYPEDFDIPKEELLRYGWGLKLYSQVSTIRQARNRLDACVEQLIHANLLIGSHRDGSVKMHDLVRAFVLSMFSEGEHVSIVNHGFMTEWPTKDVSESCKRISLTCKGSTWELPGDFTYPNLSFLRIVQGDELLSNVEDFYGGMENLQVIAYDKINYMAFPRSLQCSSNLRTLCLEKCCLTFDFSFIGDLLNLEVLSFAHSGIKRLPSIIGKLIKLKLLDLTGCNELVIDNGVFKKLVKLEELYMRVKDRCEKVISFSGSSCNDLAECSENLLALEIEFFKNDAHPMSLSFKQLERFNISLGCFSKSMNENLLPFENKLMLVTNKGELRGSRINELFVKTKVLYLQVGDMSSLEDVDIDVDVNVTFSHPPKTSSFYNLRFLSVSFCTELTYLFTSRVVSDLSKLEEVRITSCPILKALIRFENRGSETIRFPMLKRLILNDLPELSSFCDTTNVIELPQLAELELDNLQKITCIFPKNELTTSSMPSQISTTKSLLKRVVIPKLEKLSIKDMESLEEIWPCEIPSSEDVNVSLLREIRVESCNRLVHLFPINPMPLLHNLNHLQVKKCGSVEVFFNLDFGCGSEMEGKSALRIIEVEGMEKLKEVWRMKGVNNSNLPICGFQALENIEIKECRSFRNLFTPTTANFDLGALIRIEMKGIGRNNELTENGQEAEIITESKEELLEVSDNIPNVIVPSYLMTSCHHLRQLILNNYKGRELTLFEMEGSSSREAIGTNLSHLDDLPLYSMEEMRHVWAKCNWNKFFNIQPQPKSSFQSIMKISLEECKSIKYLLSPLMLELLVNLKDVQMLRCDGIEVVVSHRDDEEKLIATPVSTHTNLTRFPVLDNLILKDLKSLWHIGGGGSGRITTSNNINTPTFVNDKFQQSQVDVALWSLCQYSRRIEIRNCNALSSLVPSHAVRQMHNLEELQVWECESMIEVFESESASNNGVYVSEGSGSVGATREKFSNMIMSRLCNLKKVDIYRCDGLRDLFTFSTLESLKQLTELMVFNCKNIQVIVKEEDRADTSKVVVFPCLKSVILINLPNLNGFFLGMNEFRWHILDEVVIRWCPKLTKFTKGHSTSQVLKYIRTEFGRYECGINFDLTAHMQETPFSSLDGCSRPVLKTLPWSSFSNFTEINLVEMDDLKCIIPCNELLKLEKISIYRCKNIEKVFEELEEEGNKNECVITIPKLREVWLGDLDRLEYIWKRNNEGRVLLFPNLTILTIHGCQKLRHVISRSMVDSLLQLQQLSIEFCDNMEVIVKEEEEEEGCDDAKLVNNNKKNIMFPCLKSLQLIYLSSIKGLWLGSDEEFEWPSLLTLYISWCSAMKVFTKGKSSAPKLKVIETEEGMFDANQDPNSITKIKQQLAQGFYLGKRK